MAFIQKITLFLGNPVLSAAVVLCGFPIFSGIGSLFGGRFGTTPCVRIVRSVFAIVVVGCAYTWLLGWALGPLGDLPILGRAFVSLAITAPLAFPMGIPFSQGLVQCERRNPEFLPWAWGVNGFASVISSSLAVLFAMSFGFNRLVWTALALYILAGWVVHPLRRREHS
jgi:hypothetical protein